VLALDRVSGQLALGLVVLASAPLSVAAGLLDPSLFAGVALALGASVWLGRVLLRRAAVGWRFAAVCAGFLSRAGSVLLTPRRAVVHLPLSVLLTATLVLQLWLSALAAGIRLDIAHLVWLGPLIILAASAPSFFGSWGVREGASALLFATAGLPSSAGVTLSLVFGSFSLASALPGALVMLFDRASGSSGPDSERAPAPASPEASLPT
jgi:hypothetical protein